MISGEAYNINKQTIYIARKSEIESRAHCTPEPTWGINKLKQTSYSDNLKQVSAAADKPTRRTVSLYCHTSRQKLSVINWWRWSAEPIWLATINVLSRNLFSFKRKDPYFYSNFLIKQQRTAKKTQLDLYSHFNRTSTCDWHTHRHKLANTALAYS